MVRMDFISVGVDIVLIERITRDIIDNKSFENRVFTQPEIEYCRSKENVFHHFAGRFAGKEAVSKALKIPWEQGAKWKDIEIVDNDGIPKVVLHGRARTIADKEKIQNISISISHEKDYAVAFVIADGMNRDG